MEILDADVHLIAGMPLTESRREVIERTEMYTRDLELYHSMMGTESGHEASERTEMDDRDLEPIQTLMGEIVRKSSLRRGACLYRGEPKCYPIVSSGLYRTCPDCVDEAFDIDGLENHIVERARQYTTLDDRDEILAEIQHFGGITNLLDFTDDYLIALFFASADRNGEDGRVVLHRPNPDAVVRPRHTNNRVVFSEKRARSSPKRVSRARRRRRDRGRSR